jgi:predicted HicB family RNase H-like nuclease
MSRDATTPPPGKPPRKPLPEEMAKDAIAHEEAVGSDKVRMTFRVILDREQAEALAARAIREEKNIAALVTEILEESVKHTA